MLDTERLLQLCEEIHADNVRAGWWSDLKTGKSILETRNRGELMMLTVSELSEASYGWVNNLPDDKLPRRPMFAVELGDTAIRLFDQLGAFRARRGEWPSVVAAALAYQVDTFGFAVRGIDTCLMTIVNCISAAMEHDRKGRADEYATELAHALTATYALAATRGIPLDEIIAEKRAVNASREDHKIENRKKVGGKAY